jgi:Fur family ferric uptake transcriptional regulator
MERDTAQRRAIRTVFAEQARPLGPQEVLSASLRHIDGMGIATVYRTIKALVDERWLAVVDLPGEPPRYEIAGQAHHHHFSCRACKRVYDLPGCAGAVAAHVPAGFEVESHEVVLYGRCPTCRTPPPTAAPARRSGGRRR